VIRLWRNVGVRLAIGCGLLAIGSMALVSAAFYIGTVGVLARNTDAKLAAISTRLTRHFVRGGAADLAAEIRKLLDDGIDQDTEVYLLVGSDGRVVAGNIAAWDAAAAPLGRLTDARVIRYGHPSVSRLLPRRLADGSVLVVGRDMGDRREIEALVWHALLAGGAAALLLTIGGAWLFRRRLERRIGAIRRTAAEIVAGDLSRRIPASGVEDEFARLNRDINDMLERIEHLMDGVRNVSNAIAHDLRTPLGRIRSRLDAALGRDLGDGDLAETAGFAIQQIDDLIRLLDRLMQIAEAESGARTQSFGPVAIESVIDDVIELYDAAAEAEGITLRRAVSGSPMLFGDRNLLASAIANLVDNALKYAGGGATVEVSASESGDGVSVVVRDDGPGIPAAERPRVVERFYRLDRSRGLPGNGLGLSIVTAIATLHRGKLTLDDAAPGLAARIVMPRADVALAPNRRLAAVPFAPHITRGPAI
jgi:signal transduction histidine kinase